jgi:transcriptional regulator with XRE-family HTH domain
MPSAVVGLPREDPVPEPDEDQRRRGVIDLVLFGKYLKGLRVRQGYEPADMLVAELESCCGVGVSVRTIYAIERGEQLPRLDLLLALLVVLEENLDYFYPALSDDIVDKLKRRGSR